MSEANRIMQLKSHYAHSYLALKDKDYNSAIRGFKYLIKNNVEKEKSVIGLICAYSCIGKYQKALDTFEKHEHLLILNKSFRHMLIHDLSYLLYNDNEALKKLRDGYFSSFILGISMKRTLEEYEADNANVLAIIFLSYWYFMTGRRPSGANIILQNCLLFPTLDKDFRWKLLRRMAITNGSLLTDSRISSKFKSIPKTIDSPSYVDQLILSPIFSKDLVNAQARVSEAKELDHNFSNEVMWNYTKLTVELNEIDEISILFAITLFHNGWVDSIVSAAVKYGCEHHSPHSVQRDLEKLQLFGY